MPQKLRTATPMADWRSVKPECDVSAGWEGLKTAGDADVLGARHSAFYQFQDSIGAVLDDVDFGNEGIVIYAAEKILAPKETGSLEVFAIGDRAYWNPTTRLFTRTYDSTYLWCGMATENAGADDLEVEIDFFGHLAQVEA